MDLDYKKQKERIINENKAHRAQLSYNKNRQKIVSTFSNKASERGELLWSEDCIYSSDEKRTAITDNVNYVILYKYDNQRILSPILLYIFQKP